MTAFTSVGALARKHIPRVNVVIGLGGITLDLFVVSLDLFFVTELPDGNTGAEE